MKVLLTFTELAMLSYWIFAAVVCLGWLVVSPELMYADHLNPLMVNWNWSFLPIDVLFAVCGLVARFGPVRGAKREVLEIVGLTLMFCAGLMALSFWTLQGWFDLMWWGMNGWLVVLASVGLGCRFMAPSERQTA